MRSEPNQNKDVSGLIPKYKYNIITKNCFHSYNSLKATKLSHQLASSRPLYSYIFQNFIFQNLQKTSSNGTGSSPESIYFCALTLLLYNNNRCYIYDADFLKSLPRREFLLFQARDQFCSTQTIYKQNFTSYCLQISQLY